MLHIELRGVNLLVTHWGSNGSSRTPLCDVCCIPVHFASTLCHTLCSTVLVLL
eukprot:m.194823 g.194823  ORF g.194823 m.194823 type:complete len:53 (+) comp18664_c0_seq1:33-191(+)